MRLIEKRAERLMIRRMMMKRKGKKKLGDLNLEEIFNFIKLSHFPGVMLFLRDIEPFHEIKFHCLYSIE